MGEENNKTTIDELLSEKKEIEKKCYKLIQKLKLELKGKREENNCDGNNSKNHEAIESQKERIESLIKKLEEKIEKYNEIKYWINDYWQKRRQEFSHELEKLKEDCLKIQERNRELNKILTGIELEKEERKNWLEELIRSNENSLNSIESQIYMNDKIVEEIEFQIEKETYKCKIARERNRIFECMIEKSRNFERNYGNYEGMEEKVQSIEYYQKLLNKKF